MKKKEKIQIALIGVIILGTALYLVLQPKPEKKGSLVIRPDSGTKKQEISLAVGEVTTKFNMEVQARKRTEEEIEEAFLRTLELLGECINPQKDEDFELTESITLSQSVEETGAVIRWESSHPETVDATGKVNRKGLTQELLVTLRARITIDESFREHWFEVKVPPYPKDSPESMFYRAEQELMETEEATLSEKEFALPEAIGEVTVSLSEQEGISPALLVPFGLLLPVVFVTAKRQEKEKKKKERENELLTAYPQIITKLTLYTGAGMSLRGAWERLATEYRKKSEETKKKEAAYEEILVLAGELKNGKSEAGVYEAFGRRIGLKPYLRLASLLVNQLQKGSGALRENLEAEVRLAWELHRDRAEKKGEEAQTKLLFPMMGMLFLVMALIMVPAFFSMGM